MLGIDGLPRNVAARRKGTLGSPIVGHSGIEARPAFASNRAS